MRLRRLLPVVAVVAALGAVALLAGRPSAFRDLAYDPRGTGDLGLAAAVDVVRELGGRVDVAGRVPATAGQGRGGVDVVVVFVDRLDDRQRSGLLDWVEAGGRLVVTDPESALHGGPGLDGGSTVGVGMAPRGRCDLPGLAGLRSLDPGDGWVRYRTAPDDAVCFADAGGAFLLAQPRGEGLVVALGSPDVWVNRRLTGADNAGLLAALVVPTGDERVVVLERAIAGDGDRDLADLVPTWVVAALAQLALAFSAFALWRGRRLGRPVVEPQPVAIAASAWVAAVGALRERARQPSASLAVIRREVRRTLAGRAGLPPDASSEDLAAALGLDPEDRAALVETLDAPVEGERDLLSSARRLHALRERFR